MIVKRFVTALALLLAVPSMAMAQSFFGGDGDRKSVV